MFHTSKKIQKERKTRYFFNFNKILTLAKKKGIEPIFLEQPLLNLHLLNSQGIEFTPIEFIRKGAIYLLFYQLNLLIISRLKSQ